MDYIVTTLTPLHIGTGDNLTHYDFFLDDGKLVVYNLSALFAENPSRSEQLATAVSANPGDFSLDRFLSPAEKKNRTTWYYSLPVHPYAARNIRRREVREGIKDTFTHLPVIPGSSIKGAFRNIILVKIIKENQKISKNLYQKVMSEGDKFLSNLFRGKENDAKYDYLRALRISDSFAFEAERSWTVYAQKVLSASIPAGDSPGKASGPYQADFKGFLTLLGCIESGTRLKGTIRFEQKIFEPLSRDILGWKPHHLPLTPEYITSAVNEFSREVCIWEFNYFEKLNPRFQKIVEFYRNLLQKLENPPPSTCYLCLGWGSGWHKITIGLMFQKEGEKRNFEQFRKKYRLVHRGRNQYLRFQYPKSRKLIMQNDREPLTPPGWVELKFL